MSYIEILLISFKDRQSVCTLLNSLTIIYYENPELAGSYLVPVFQLVKDFQLEAKAAGLMFRILNRDGNKQISELIFQERQSLNSIFESE
jgi:hypothetical protein